jgi:YesN/AraC family two-component response regulator
MFFTSFAVHPSITKEHSHPGWEIVCYLCCSGKIFIANKEYSFQHGSIIFIPPNLLHYEVAENEMTIGCLGVKTLFNMENKVYHFMDNSNSDFFNIFKQLDTVYKLKPVNFERIQDGLLNIMEQYALSWNSSKHKNTLVDELEYRLIEVISKKDVRLENLLDNIPVCGSYLRKLFKAETGKSPMEYLMDLRMENAKQLMSNTSLTIKNVASLVGFSDPYYFSRAFKKVTGKYPSQWRNEGVNFC